MLRQARLGEAEEAGAFQPYVDEGGLNAGQYPFDPAQIDVAGHAFPVGPIDHQFAKARALDQGDAPLSRRDFDQYRVCRHVPSPLPIVPIAQAMQKRRRFE